MKQHISSEDLEQLSEKGRERLREWWKPLAWHVIYAPDLYDGVLSSVADIPYGTLKDYYPLLSIGQMIEFLDEHIDSSISSLAIDRGEHQWHVYALDSIPIKPGIGNGRAVSTPELCDALWEATKQVLEREE